MRYQKPTEQSGGVAFGRRKVVPHACIADSKPHIRSFLRDALEELGFVASECDHADDVGRVALERQPDLFVVGLSGGGIAANRMLETLGGQAFTGRVLLFGPTASPMVSALLTVGEDLGLTMLPLLSTPFSDVELRSRLASILPAEAPPNPPVDVAEAIHANWLELWYQPKIELHTLTLSGAEALVRMHHPTWGTVPPAYFIPDDDDPHFGMLSDFVLSRAVRDWRYFVTEYGPLEIAVNLPFSFFHHPAAIENLARHLPEHPAFGGMIVEINASEIVRDLALARDIARELKLRNVVISVDDLGTDWPSLIEVDNFPFVEIKVDRTFVTGCADDRLKQVICRRILELADRFGARTVAEGVETRADFLMARELGFDLVQGFFFAKAMEPHKFVRRILNRPVEMPH